MSLTFQERPAAGTPEGVLVLHHGRGSDDHDLLGLADLLDPDRRLHVATPRAPLQLPGWPGYHWYVVPRVGFPEPESFEASRLELAAFHDDLLERTGLGPERLVLGGFSQGTVMSWALALSPERPAPAGVLALSGFVPTVPAWEPSFRPPTRAFIAHGTQDPVIGVDFGRDAAARATGAGLDVEAHEFPGAHNVDPRQLPLMARWLADTLA